MGRRVMGVWVVVLSFSTLAPFKATFKAPFEAGEPQTFHTVVH